MTKDKNMQSCIDEVRRVRIHQEEEESKIEYTKENVLRAIEQWVERWMIQWYSEWWNDCILKKEYKYKQSDI